MFHPPDFLFIYIRKENHILYVNPKSKVGVRHNKEFLRLDGLQEKL